ncbi:MAG TPA: hypothetical protein VK447_09240 [Myxococcaceae bacterium]|nr:hypothetical protein [Myxococcaceae bacterium]
MSRFLLLLLFALSAPALALSAPAPDPSAPPAELAKVSPTTFQSRVSPNQVQLGEPFTYEVVLVHPPTQRYELKVPADLGAFDVLEVGRERKDAAAQTVTTFRVKLALFELGKKTMPDFTFDVYEEGRTARFVLPGGSAVECVGTLPEDAAEKGEALYDYKPPEDVPVRSWRLLYVLAGVAAAALLGYLLYRWWRRPRDKALVVEPALPADVRALRALDTLRAEDLPHQGRGREFFFRLSEIVRGYLGQRYAFEALECTTPELLAALRKLDTPGLKPDEVRAFAETSDFVKFARQEPSLDDCKQALDYAYGMVRTTTAAALAAAPPPTTPAHGPGSRVP